MDETEHLDDPAQEREELRNDLENEFKFFSATNEFRPGMLDAIIAKMRRYDSIDAYLQSFEPPPLPIEEDEPETSAGLATDEQFLFDVPPETE